jgi:hypothetical protein
MDTSDEKQAEDALAHRWDGLLPKDDPSAEQVHPLLVHGAVISFSACQITA